MKGSSGTIFDISRYCLNDGPGIRTTVFLKGCPLRCVWCHNPESQNPFCEILSESDGTIQTAGRDCQVEAVMQEVLKDEVYYIQSGGGVTISGGEPMQQIDFLENLLKAAKNKDIHTCVETCGYAPSSDFEKIAPLVDCFLFDWKESDPEKHLAFTGVDNHLIRENLALMDRLGCEIILRLPLIPGYNDTREHLKGCAEITNKYKSIKAIEILPYHPLGTAKLKKLGRMDEAVKIAVPSKNLLDNYSSQLRMMTAVDVCVCS